MTKTVATVFLSLVFLACGSNETDQNVNQREIWVENKTVTIDRTTCGESEIALLFIHGWCIDKSFWADQTKHFCPNYKVVTMDLPGFGGSGKDRTSYSIEGYADDVIGVMDELDLNKVVLIGHSMGGDIILETALKDDRVVALVGVDNFKNVGLDFNEETDKQIQAFLGQMSSDFPNVAIQYAETGLFHVQTSANVKDRVRNSIQQTNPNVAVETLKALFSYVPNEADRLALLKQRLYLINSSASPTLTTGLDASGVNYKKFDVGMTGHYPMAEEPETFNSILDRILVEVINQQ